MLESLKSIVRNTAIIYSVELINKVLQFVFIIYAARSLGVKTFGDLSYILTLYTFLQMLSDYGLGYSLPREIAQSPGGRDWTFRIALRLRAAVTAAALLVFVLYLYAVKDPNAIRLAVVLGGLGLLLSSYAQNYVLSLRGLSLMKIDGAIRVSATFITTVLSVAAIMAGTGVIGVAAALFLGNIFMVATALWVNRKTRVIGRPEAAPSGKDYLLAVKKGVPLMLMIIVASFYNRVDTLLLQHLKGAVEVGLYHAAMRVTEGLLIFQAAFAMVLLPTLSRHIGEKDTEAVEKITRLSIKYMAMIGIFLTVVTIMTADKIIEVLYFSPEYSGSVLGLQLFAFVNLMLYITTPLGYLLVSSRYEKIMVLLTFLMLVLNAGINLLVIPKYGFAGAAVVRFGTEVFGLIGSLIFINKFIFRLDFFAEFKKPLIAGLATAGFIYFAKSLLFIPLYLMLYGTLLYIMKAVTRWEVGFVKGIFIDKLKGQGRA